MRVPDHIEATVVPLVFNELDNMCIAGKSPKAPYARWLKDPGIGGQLMSLMTAEDARVWMKDGPVKEYVRAKEGLTRFAQYVLSPPEPIEDVIVKALGRGCVPYRATMEDKPLRLTVDLAGLGPAVVAWGTVNTFKDLVWGAIQKKANGDTRTWVLLVTTHNDALPPAKSAELRRISEWCGLRFEEVERRWA